MKLKLLYVVLFIVLPAIAYADTSSLSLALPNLPMNYQSDKFRAGDLDCSNAIGSATQMEFGVTGLINNGDSSINRFANDNASAGDVGVYARIVIPLGKVAKSRIDCNRLYELELRKKQLEVMKLEQQINQLRQLQFEN
jgi:hypothetical protein